MSNLSDSIGRSLEFKLVEILENQKQFKLSSTSSKDQLRDKVKFDSISPSLQISHEKACNKIIEWLEKEFKLNSTLDRKLHRLSDDNAKKGDVTDIRLNCDNQVINISLKHNHSAFKHQRPGAMPAQLGYNKTDQLFVDYKKSYKKLTDAFLARAKQTYPTASTYPQLKEYNANFIEDYLYYPMCCLVSDFINKNGQASHASFLFRFLVGNIDFHKIIVYGQEIHIFHFADIKVPVNVVSHVQNKSYVTLNFSNKWVISMRLHTASTSFSGVSIKFDTQPIDIPVIKSILKY